MCLLISSQIERNTCLTLDYTDKLSWKKKQTQNTYLIILNVYKNKVSVTVKVWQDLPEGCVISVGLKMPSVETSCIRARPQRWWWWWWGGWETSFGKPGRASPIRLSLIFCALSCHSPRISFQERVLQLQGKSWETTEAALMARRRRGKFCSSVGWPRVWIAVSLRVGEVRKPWKAAREQKHSLEVLSGVRWLHVARGGDSQWSDSGPSPRGLMIQTRGSGVCFLSHPVPLRQKLP